MPWSLVCRALQQAGGATYILPLKLERENLFPAVWPPGMEERLDSVTTLPGLESCAVLTTDCHLTVRGK